MLANDGLLSTNMETEMAKRPNSEADDGGPSRKIDLSPPWSGPDPILRNRIQLGTPWGGSNIRFNQSQEAEVVLEAFIRERTAAHTEFIRQTEKTKRVGYSLAAALLAIAIIIPVFAPAGRETMSWITSAALALFSAGAFGFSKLKLQAFKQSFEAESRKSSPVRKA